MRVAKIPYLNSQPFYGAAGDPSDAGIEWVETGPAELGRMAREGRVDAGLIPVADFFRVEDRFERLGSFGIAVSGPVESVLLLAERPLGALGGTRIGVTEETSTSFKLLRLLLEVRHGAKPAAYLRGVRESVEACLVIGDEALQATASGQPAPVVVDLAEEWRAWQALPFVFAVWVARKDLAPERKARLASILDASLAGIPARGDAASAGAGGPREASAAGASGASPAVIARIADEYGSGSPARRALGGPERLARYLARFTYRLEAADEAAILRFRRLLEENGLAGDVG